MSVKITKQGEKIKISADAPVRNTWAAVLDRGKDLIVFYAPNYQKGTHAVKTMDGQVEILDGKIQSIAIYGPKVSMIEAWLRGQIEAAGLDNEYSLE